MTERFSAQGSPELWLASSIETLESLGFRDLKYEPGNHEVSGNLNGNLTIKVSPEENNKTLLSIESDSAENIDAYKNRVTQALSYFKNRPETSIYLRLSTPVDELEEPEVIYPQLEQPTELEGLPAPEEVISQEIEPEPTPQVQEKPVWYKTTWFIFLISIICPPLGIFMMWKFNIFYNKDRRIFTIFFGLYTILWIWLLYTLLFYRAYTGIVQQNIEDNGTELDQINAYWSTEPIANYISQMPNLINSYDNLAVNGELGTEAGNQTAETIFAQVQTLSEGVLGVGELASTNAAYTLQQKVNESAQAFLNAVQSGREALGSGDLNIINESVNSWNSAENNYYEINYIYQSAIQMATENTNNSGEDTLIVDQSSDSTDLIEDLQN